MTTMDQLLNSSSIELFPATVVASWVELEPGYSSAPGGGFGGVDSLSQIGQQVGPNGFTVVHSIDDGLPDPVTSTNGNDASGTLDMDLVGRPPVIATVASLHWNALSTTGSGTGTLITTTLPSDPAFWDYVIVALTVNSDTLVTETSMPAETLWPWKKIADVSDGGFHTYVFARKHYTSGVVAPKFTLDASAAYAWVIGSIDVGKTASLDVMLPMMLTDIEVKGEVSSVTAHAQTPVTIQNRGWNVGIFGGANTAGAWTSTGNTIVGQVAGSAVSTALVTSPLRQIGGAYAMTANSNVATGNVAMIHLAIEVRDRPAQDAVAYFSTFNQASPIYGFDRDTATLQAATNHMALDGTGIETNIIFKGQMAGIGIDGRTAQLGGLSKTRLLLDGSRALPSVYGWREGLTTDWLAGWLLAQAGQYIGVAPSIYTRWWAPQYGSLHPYMDGSACYTECREWNIARPGGTFRRAATSTDGPFATAMFGQQLNNSVIQINGTTDRNWATEVPGISDPLLNDVFSQQNSKGQVTFWIRMDPFVASPAAVTSGDPNDNLLFWIGIWNNYLGTNLHGIRLNVNTDGSFNTFLGSQTSNLVGGGVVADGNWHFIGYYWDYAAATGKLQYDNVVWNITGNSNLETLPVTDATMISTGGYNVLTYYSHLPIADLQYEAGINDFSRYRPNPTPNALFRPSQQPLAAIANPTPLQGWPTLQDVAQSTLSHLRCDEADNAWFLALDYFGEAAQMTVDTLNVIDTDFNAGQPSAVDDTSLTRNVVTIQYTDTQVGSARSPILEMNTSLAIPRGVTLITFPLDTPTAETHGAAAWWTTTPEFQKLTALQVAGTNAIQNENVMSVNTLPDGTGTVFTSTAFKARIMDWDSSSIVVQFTNTYSSTLYLANNGTQIPFLRALGYAISTSDGYVTVRDEGSIGTRRERALTTQMNWITDRTTAQQVASTLVTLLARPRPQLTVTVQGDPRRKPGTLCQVIDSTGMKADGNWRIYKIQHNYNGPQYTQDLTLIRVGVIGNWDEGLWDDAVWGE